MPPGRTAGGFRGGSEGIVEEPVGYDHQPRIAALRARLAAANANVAKLQAQIKAAKKKKNKAKAKKSTTSLKTAMAQVASANADLAKYWFRPSRNLLKNVCARIRFRI